MTNGRDWRAALLALLILGLPAAGGSRAQTPGPRLALVVGEAAYRDAPLTTATNDAGLVAQTLAEVGFDVTGGADLGEEALRGAVREFVGKAERAGPAATVFVYFAGRGVQYAGDNFFVPVDATIARDADVPVAALRLGDVESALGAIALRARIIVLDGARANGFARSGPPLAGGLALVDPPPGMLYALNAAPGTAAPDEPGPYGVYAAALAEMLRQGGVPIETAFARLRLRVNAETRGAVVPWDVSTLAVPLILLAALPNAPLPPPPTQALRDLPPPEAYGVAVERDTLAAYQEFLTAFAGDPLAARVRILLAARREALTWARTAAANVPPAYWTYLRRYPRGPHVADARRRLAALNAPLEPPPRFDIYVYDGVPPPPDADYEIVDRPVFDFDAGGPPPPPPPGFLVPLRDPAFERLPPPGPAPEHGLLPIPLPLPLPFGRPGGPGHMEPPTVGQQQPAGPAPGGRPGAGTVPAGGAPPRPPMPAPPAAPAAAPPPAAPHPAPPPAVAPPPPLRPTAAPPPRPPPPPRSPAPPPPPRPAAEPPRPAAPPPRPPAAAGRKPAATPGHPDPQHP